MIRYLPQLFPEQE